MEGHWASDEGAAGARSVQIMAGRAALAGATALVVACSHYRLLQGLLGK